jgi:4-methyl-5(b-hydroxyethyl)-thiazole monophosphate biosynthesis
MARVLVPIADGVEEIEAVTIIDVLRRAGVEVVSAGLTGKPVTASRKVKLIPDKSLEAVKDEAFDMIVLPGGGDGVDNLKRDPRVEAILRRMNQGKKWVAAVCAAPALLAAYGILEGKEATSHPSRREQTTIGNVRYQEQAVIQDGHIITSRGPGTALKFALKLVEVLCGREKVEELKEAMVIGKQGRR